MSGLTRAVPLFDTASAGRDVRRPIPRGLMWLGAASWLVLATILVRLTIFMQAPAPLAAIGWSIAPWNAFLAQHACTTAYWLAATRVEQKPNLYDSMADGSRRDPETGARVPAKLGPHNIDPYEYPPTFLPLPRVIAALTPDFAAFRRTWFFLNAIGVIVVLVAVARSVGGEATSTRALLTAPLAVLPFTVLMSLQMGNVQLLFVGLAMVAMAAFERRRDAIGGLLLAYTIVGKLFPGILVVYLVVQRRWQALGWTAAWSAALTLVTLVDVGWQPFVHFFDHLPKLLSGEAFPMLRLPFARVNSVSLPGLVLKLHAFGGPEVPLEALRLTGWIHTVVLLWITVRLARRPLGERYAPLAWLVILAFATLRSPFLPAYGLFQGAWLASLLLAICWEHARMRWAVLGLWLVFVPVIAGPSAWPAVAVASLTIVQTLAVLVLCWLAIRVGRGGDSGTPVSVPAASAAGR